MGRGVQLGIKSAILIIFFNVLVENCLKSKQQNERDSPFKTDKNFRENRFEGSDCHNMITVMELPSQEVNLLSIK